MSRRGDMKRISFPSGLFDRVFSISVLEHVPRPDRLAAWREPLRILRSGGLAVLTLDWVFRMNPALGACAAER